jgi:hypothetical protein
MSALFFKNIFKGHCKQVTDFFFTKDVMVGEQLASSAPNQNDNNGHMASRSNSSSSSSSDSGSSSSGNIYFVFSRC